MNVNIFLRVLNILSIQFQFIIATLVQQGKSKKAKGKRKKDYFISFSTILDGGFISAVVY
jgi:hypothetical protein